MDIENLILQLPEYKLCRCSEGDGEGVVGQKILHGMRFAVFCKKVTTCMQSIPLQKDIFEKDFQASEGLCQ